MAESLRYGIVVDPWTQGMSNNNIAERFLLQDCYRPGSYSVYSWFEALNYDLNSNHGICPDGWHIPDLQEWKSLNGNYPALYIAKYLGENGLSGLNLQNGVYVSVDKIDKMIWCDTELSSYWGSDHDLDTSNVFRAGHVNFLDGFSIGFEFLDQSQLEGKDRYQIVNTVRCIKDLH